MEVYGGINDNKIEYIFAGQPVGNDAQKSTIVEAP